MKTISIKKIEYLYENRKNKRELKITLSNKTIIRACACYESFEQYGGTVDELYLTLRTVERHNIWLHGGPRP